jgi:hypothetical protein
VGNNFFLDSIASGTGPELNYTGSPVTVGEFGAWTPIGAEQTANGYEVAWGAPGSGQFIVWLTDANGNYQSNTGALSGTSTTLQQYEVSFQQDLNGDSTVGIPGTKIETKGSTILTQTAGNNLYMTNTDGSGAELIYSGAAVTTGQFGAWTPIGAEKTASGYEVAWTAPGSGQFIVWLTDANGNYQSNSGPLSGTSTALEQYETSFHQDLNGDTIIGVPGAPQTVAAAVSQPPAADFLNHDNFAFLSSAGALAGEIAAAIRAQSSNPTDHGGFWHDVFSAQPGFFHEVLQALAPLALVGGTHDANSDLFHQQTAMQLHLTDLHGFFVH